MSRCVAPALLAALLVVPVMAAHAPRALAQDGQGDADRALAHFDAGQSHFQEGDYDAALAEFRRAYELTHQAPVLRQIADCEERLGRYGDAAHDLHALLESGTALDDRSALESRAQSLDARAAAQQTAPPATTSGGGVPALAVVSFVVAGVGALALAVAGPIALVMYDDVKTRCGDAHACMAGDLDATHALALVADIGLGLAVAGGVVGLIALLTSGSAGEHAPQHAHVAVAPLLLPSGGGLGVAGWL